MVRMLPLYKLTLHDVGVMHADGNRLPAKCPTSSHTHIITYRVGIRRDSSSQGNSNTFICTLNPRPSFTKALDITNGPSFIAALRRASTRTTFVPSNLAKQQRTQLRNGFSVILIGEGGKPSNYSMITVDSRTYIPIISIFLHGTWVHNDSEHPKVWTI